MNEKNSLYISNWFNRFCWFSLFFIQFFIFSVEFIWYNLISRLTDLHTFKFNILNGTTYFNKIILNDSKSYKFNDLLIYNNFIKYDIYDFNHYRIILLELFIKNIFYNNTYSALHFNTFYLLRNIMRLKQIKSGFYNYLIQINSLTNFFKIILLYLFNGFKYLWKGIRFWILPLIFLILIVYFGLITKVLPFNKVIFIWLAFFMVLYWLVSGFVFFFKKYQYGKYTSAIQRFWRRSYILFWLLESCLLIVFVYLTFIASQESFYMFDQIQIYKTHLFSWRIFFLKMFPITLLLILAYFFLLTIKWNVFSKHSLWLLIFTIILTYIIWVEFYQFFHIVNFYGNLIWNYDVDEKIWNLELEARRTRIVNHYVMWLLILKFWHLLFVYGFWIFFILRNIEKTHVKYPLFSANHQNLIILFLMNWLYMFPWIKIYFRKFLDMPYFWFYVNNRNLLVRLFFNDLKNFWYAIYTTDTIYFYKTIFLQTPFFYWIETNKNLIYNQTRKHFIRNQIVDLIYTF